MAALRHARFGEELGMEAVPLGDDVKKDGENVWISRMPIELARREAQPVSSSETRAHRTSSERRKVRAREARREAARRNGGKPRERCKAGSREGSEPRKGDVTGVGRKIRSEVVRGASRWLPWSRCGRPGQGLSDTTSARRQRVIVDVAPRSTGGFGRTVTRGRVASRPTFRSPCSGNGAGRQSPRPKIGFVSSAQRWPEPGWAFACRHLAVQLLLHQREVIGMGHPDAAALGREDLERAARQ